jgi:hypothetical protein
MPSVIKLKFDGRPLRPEGPLINSHDRQVVVEALLPIKVHGTGRVSALRASGD